CDRPVGRLHEKRAELARSGRGRGFTPRSAEQPGLKTSAMPSDPTRPTTSVQSIPPALGARARQVPPLDAAIVASVPQGLVDFRVARRGPPPAAKSSGRSDPMRAAPRGELPSAGRTDVHFGCQYSLG